MQHLIAKASSKGQKQQAERDVLKALRSIKVSKKNISLTIVPFLNKVLTNLEPRVIPTTRKFKRTKYTIPVYVTEEKELSFGVFWLVKFSCGRRKGSRKKCLIEGLDDIDLSLEKINQIDNFEKKIDSQKPWILNNE